jgi:hypothetical protein
MDPNLALGRAQFMLERQIDSPYDLYRFWKLFGPAWAGPRIERTFPRGWWEGLTDTL